MLDQAIIDATALREAAIKGFPGFKELKAYERYADRIVDDILHVGRTPGKNPVTQLQEIGTKLLRQDKYQFLKTGEELPDVIKKLMGQQKDLRAQVLSTVTDATASTAQKAGFDRIAAIGLKNGWLFTSPEAARNTYIGAQQIGKIKRTGALNSTIENLYTSPELVQMFQGAGNVLDRLTSAAVWRQMLQFKVGVQMGKTLYSPQTQVRNVTSASFFALYNGHLGHAANVGDSFRMVIRDIFKAGKYQPIDDVAFNEYVEKLVRLGVWDENVVASELRAVLKNLRDGKINTEDEIFERLVKNLPTEKVARLYAGGDNLWKQYGYEFYKSDLRSALKSIKDVEDWFRLHAGRFDRKELISGATKSYDDALDEAAAFALRNTYPTYSKVPEAIKAIRKLPFGNFVSFPAEMMRTSFNIMDIGMKEIASSNAALRQIGYRRMIGAYTVLGGAGTAALNLASELTGTTLEEIEAYKSFAADWNKNSILLPINKWVKGKGKAINFSYFSPYDVVQRPFEAMFATWKEGRLSNDKRMDIFLSSMGATLGEMFDSFVSEPLGYERILDVLPRGKFGREGQKKAGGFVYSRTDSPGDIWMKSFVHVLEGVEPGVSTTGRKIASALEGELKTGGQAYSLRDEALALFSGIRIIDVDVPNNLDYKITGYQVDKRAVTKAEKFYSLDNATDRGPDTLAAEYLSLIHI